MNKTAIKKFAVESRQKLIKSTIERLEELGITDNEVVELVELGGVYTVKAQTLTESKKKNRDTIIQKIQEKGYEPFVEEIAYTWFNRIIAIRYMEVNDYLPFRTRVLSSEVPGKVDPDIITEIADHIEELELNRDKVIELKEHNKQEELFKYVFIKVCNYFGQLLPVMFEQIEDYTELLLPSVMISNGSVIKDMIELVPEEDWTNQVEIIGWLYQYYISDKKDQVFADLKKNKKITKENIPAATQLFTPKWIVKYMVENSLGRFWIEGHPNKELKTKWNYYLEEAEQEPKVEEELKKIRKVHSRLIPEDIKLLDPCMGSGHILVYAFDVLYEIYQSEGYSEREIPRLILQNNLYGLDIDDRAGQLAYFALIMKARQYNRRLFRELKRKPLELNLCSIQETNIINKDMIDYFVNGDKELRKDLEYLCSIFIDAKEYGSIIEVDNVNLERIKQRLREIEDAHSLMLDKYREILLEKLPIIIKQTEIMSNKYEICTTNPPYLGRKGMNAKITNYVDLKYKKTKQDLYAVFMERTIKYTKNQGYSSMINQHSWMFLVTFESFREYINNNIETVNMLHLGTRAFDEIGGEVVQTTTFVFRNIKNKEYIASYIDLTKGDSEKEKEEMFFKKNKIYKVKSSSYNYLPFKVIGYWLSKNMLNNFNNSTRIQDIADSKKGLDTADNDRFLRLWHEVNRNNIGMGLNDCSEFEKNKYIWNPLNKGGGFRRWYGNRSYVIKWRNNGIELKEFPRATIRNEQYYFRSGITWSDISTGKFAARYTENGFIFEATGHMLFTNEHLLKYILGYMNTNIFQKFADITCTGLHYSNGSIAQIPINTEWNNYLGICNIVDDCVELCKNDWDSFETSWDFQKHPLMKFKSNTIQSSLESWVNFVNEEFNKLKSNEKKLNRIFIDIYDLASEVSSDVEDKDITIRKADRDRDIKSLISYAVGCMMGRYSLDDEGLIFAGGQFDSDKYQTFKADEDGILLISDTEYFEDDLLNRFVEFVKVVYGEETLEENLDFIADTECFKRKSTESARDCLRRYFLKGFIEDHLKVYQKRPIYWMFDSGKQNGFKALIYMHRYNEDMVAKVRTDYLHPLQRKYEAELERLDHLINFDNISTSEKGKAKKRQEQIHKQLDECTQYDLLLAHVAHQRIPLDLDDGVKVNYQKFQNIELTADGTSKAKKGDLLYKVKM